MIQNQPYKRKISINITKFKVEGYSLLAGAILAICGMVLNFPNEWIISFIIVYGASVYAGRQFIKFLKGNPKLSKDLQFAVLISTICITLAGGLYIGFTEAPGWTVLTLILLTFGLIEAWEAFTKG